MAQVSIRDLDDELIADYTRAAKDHGRSLEAELSALLEKNRPKPRPSRNQLRAMVEANWAQTPPGAAKIDSTALIRADRDER